ncbi:MAG: putative sulfate exporter family transporter, partial [Actinomycetospora chiangmaiensis]|nr:putative sulfate exporter family transporter [Actinomycetospora chiangmaiensis]
VIDADGEDVASSIAFTAVLGVLVVLGLPLLVPLLGLSPMQYGVLAGLTVYAVPQVLAATAPVAALSVQVGTLVKLVRVLMLGPVVLALSLWISRLRSKTGVTVPHPTAGERPASGRMPLHRLVPWFILAFLALAGLRSAGLVPEAALHPMATTANALTIVSMAALGLGVDVRSVAKAGPRVTLAVVASLAALTAVSLGLIRMLGIA